jgi:hypothetical protein
MQAFYVRQGRSVGEYSYPSMVHTLPTTDWKDKPNTLTLDQPYITSCFCLQFWIVGGAKHTLSLSLSLCAILLVHISIIGYGEKSF